MITANPYGTRRVTRPGYGEPEPLQRFKSDCSL